MRINFFMRDAEQIKSMRSAELRIVVNAAQLSFT